jgi:hypothetical protein
LRAKIREAPQLSVLDLERMGINSKKALTNAFGSISRALSLAGRDAASIRALHERSKLVGRKVGDQLTRDVAELLNQNDCACRVHPRSRLLVLDERLRVRIQLVWPRKYPDGDAWYVLKKYRPRADMVLLVQMRDVHNAEGFLLLDMPAFRALPPWLGTESPGGIEGLLRNAQVLVNEIRKRVDVRRGR